MIVLLEDDIGRTHLQLTDEFTLLQKVKKIMDKNECKMKFCIENKIAES